MQGKVVVHLNDADGYIMARNFLMLLLLAQVGWSFSSSGHMTHTWRQS